MLAFAAVMSVMAKPVTPSLNVKVAVKLLSLKLLAEREEDIVTPGCVLSTVKVEDGPALPAIFVEFLAVLPFMLIPNVPSPVMLDSVTVALLVSPLVTVTTALGVPVLFRVIADAIRFT